MNIRNHIDSMFKSGPSEWQQAASYMFENADGYKLSHSSRPYNFKNSFIKINGKIYEIARGKHYPALLGEGVHGKAKLVQDKLGHLYVLKVCKYEYALEHEEKEQAYLNQEAEILHDLNIGQGGNKRVNPGNERKHYMVQKYCGQSLEDYLANRNFRPGSKQEAQAMNQNAFDLAIKACMALYRLHSGTASKTNTSYAHLDIKADNLTVERDGNALKVHVIDFGLAEKNIDLKYGHEVPNDYKSAYFPTNPNDHSKREMDIFALKKVIYLPDVIKCSNGDIEQVTHSQRKHFSIFYAMPSKLLEDSIYEFDHSAASLAATLIIFKYLNPKIMHLINAEKLSRDPLTSLAICRIYENDHQDNIEQNILAYLKFNNAIECMKLKRDGHEERGNLGAVAACDKLINNILKEKNDFVYAKDHQTNYATNLSKFKRNCLEHGNKAKGMLSIHDGFLGFLEEFITCLASLVVFYPLALYIKTIKHWSIFSTDSRDKLDCLEKSIKKLAP